MTIDSILLTEGIKYFKYSKRIKGYVETISKKEVKNEELKNLIEELKVLQKKFYKLEKAYKEADTKEELNDIKVKWEVLKVKDEKLLEKIRSEELKNTAIVAGVFALLLGVFIFISHGIDSNIEKIDKSLEGFKNTGNKAVSPVDSTTETKVHTETHKLSPQEELKREKSSVPYAVQKAIEEKKNSNSLSPIDVYSRYDVPQEGTYSKADLIAILKAECKKQNFPFEIAKEVVKTESGWDYKVYSKTGDAGLMQLNMRYSDEFAKKWYRGNEEFNPFNPKHNVEAGIRWLRHLIKINGGDLRKALVDYNAGPSRDSTPKSALSYADRIMIALGNAGGSSIKKGV